MYRLYIDEVGNSTLGPCTDSNERYLSLTGIIFEQSYVKTTVFPIIEELKYKYFNSHPDEPIILHRKELVNKRHPFHSLRDPEVEFAFNKEFLGHLQTLDYKVITVTLDKKDHQERYKVWQFEPYHYCLSVMVERYIYWLEYVKGDVGDVLAESRGGNEDKRLKASFERAYKEGTKYVVADKFKKLLTSQHLKMKPKSSNITGLQLADIIAHPSYRASLAYREQSSLPENFGGQIAKILEDDKYLRINNKIEGWGRKWLP